MKVWRNLNNQQKELFENYCNKQFGKSFVKSETGEPLYFDNDLNIINTDLIIALLFEHSSN